MTIKNILFTQLSQENLKPGKWIDGLVAGQFTDMLGRPVTFKPEEFSTYLSNTKAAIAAATTEGGEVVGLPVDILDHKGDGGAGWLVDVQLAGDGLLRFLPKWTEVGEELIGKGLRRFFSASVDTIHQVILGGTLTNWPATRDPQGKVMLRPIELSQARGVFQLDADESLDEKSSAIRRAFYAAVGEPESEPYICEVFDGYVIVRAGDALYRVDYTQAADGGITFQDRAQWVEVKETFVEAALSLFRDSLNKAFGGWFTKPPKTHSEEPMTIKLSDLSEADRTTLLTQLAAQLQPPPGGAQTPPPAGGQSVTTPTFDLSTLFNLSGMTATGRAQLEQWSKDQAALMQQQVQLQLTANMAQVARTNRYTELSQRLTGGSTETPRGLKGVTADELKTHFLALSEDEAQFWGRVLEGVVKDGGLVEFTELGHSKVLEGTVELTAPYAGMLRTWIDDGHSVDEFFRANATELGDAKQYNLSAFKVKA